MRVWVSRHRAPAILLATALGLVFTEGALLLYYLDSWLTLPL
jgi:hypothetical protein